MGMWGKVKGRRREHSGNGIEFGRGVISYLSRQCPLLQAHLVSLMEMN